MTDMAALPKLELLKELFLYDSESGNLIRRGPASKFGGGPSGSIVGSYHTGYLRVRVAGHHYYVHRLIYMLVTGRDPREMQIDHVNQNRPDNRWCNLRLVTKSENLQNKCQYANNKSGVTGVYFRKDSGQWRAAIGSGSTRISLGSFKTKELAIEARLAAENEHGYHENHGRAA